MSKILQSVNDLSYTLVVKLTDAYVAWFNARYMFTVGDLVVNTKPLFLNDHTAYIQSYLINTSSSMDITLAINTPMLCIGYSDGQSDLHGISHYILRLYNRDVLLPERLMIYFKVVHRFLETSE
jgi:hypothetical protein